MSFKAVERFEKEREKERVAERAEEARRELKRAVKDVIPKGLMAPKRGKGRGANGGLSKREIAALRAEASRYLNGQEGLTALEQKIQHTALVILLIDGHLGTEPWRSSGGPHGAIVSANARLRYLENAARLLADLRASRVGNEPKLLEGVFDAQMVDGGGDESAE